MVHDNDQGALHPLFLANLGAVFVDILLEEVYYSDAAQGRGGGKTAHGI